MARTRVDFDDRELRKNLETFDSDLRAAFRAVTDRRAAVTVGWMKQNAPWTDRTGAARVGLMAWANHGRSFEEIVMSYSVNYGIWLEIANNRRFSIIQPAMRIMGDAWMKDLHLLIERMSVASITPPTPSPGLPKQPNKPQPNRKKYRRRNRRRK